MPQVSETMRFFILEKSSGWLSVVGMAIIKAMNALLNHLNKNLFRENTEVSDIKVHNTRSDHAVTSDTTKQKKKFRECSLKDRTVSVYFPKANVIKS